MPKLRTLWLYLLILLVPIMGMSEEDRENSLSGKARTYSLSGKGWVTFRFASESPDLPFIREFVEKKQFYEESREASTWTISDVKAGYHDLNDDGVPEMLLWLDVSTFFCDNVDCDLHIFQLQDGQWREILFETSQNGVWVSDEKVQGWHTLYAGGGSGYLLRWKGGSYVSDCTELPPVEIRLPNKIVCSTI